LTQPQPAKLRQFQGAFLLKPDIRTVDYSCEGSAEGCFVMFDDRFGR
jgi:hypothetical protein